MIYRVLKLRSYRKPNKGTLIQIQKQIAYHSHTKRRQLDILACLRPLTCE